MQQTYNVRAGRSLGLHSSTKIGINDGDGAGQISHPLPICFVQAKIPKSGILGERKADRDQDRHAHWKLRKHLWLTFGFCSRTIEFFIFKY